MSRPITFSEHVADGAVHVIGVAASIVGMVLLIIYAAGIGPLETAAVSVYGGAIIVGFLASAIYNVGPWDRWHTVFQRIDHASIYLKIAGTYTPLVIILGSIFGYIMLGFIWGFAVFGMVMKLAVAHWSEKLSQGLYLGLGWASILLIWPLSKQVGTGTTALIFAGGVLYTTGVIFFNWESLKYQRAIWHVFVLAASACFFGAISLSIG